MSLVKDLCSVQNVQNDIIIKIESFPLEEINFVYEDEHAFDLIEVTYLFGQIPIAMTYTCSIQFDWHIR